MTSDTFTCVRVEGSILPTDLLQRVAGGDARLDGLRVEDYGLVGEKINEATNHAWTRLSAAWEAFKAARDNLPPTDPGQRLTVERWLLPFWKVLGYSTLDKVTPFVIDEKTYPVSHVRHHSPFQLVGFRQDLDKRVETGGKQFSPHGLVQEFLNRSDSHLWGFVSNGLKLRILRDNIRLTRQAFVEFDLQAMFDGKLYADFALLWRLCHESRVNAEKPEQCWLERWSKVAAEQGLRALDQLRTGVENAVKALGLGFLACPANADLKAALKHNRLTPQEYYRQLLRVVYRFLFLFVAEDRELLCDPSAPDAARDRYARFYSAARLRRIAERLRGGPHTDLYEGLSLVLNRLGTTNCPELALQALGGLFDLARTPNLTGCRLANADLLEAVRALSVISDGQARRSVDYRNLGAEELGSVYESLLELQPRFDPDAISFTLETAGGNERKTTGSYYTPRSLITCLLDSALDPVLAEAAAKPNPEAAILALKVCDPACGSGHFLIAAAHRIAKKLASIRTAEDEPAPDAVRHALRDVIGRCVYGVDINPMAVELCQVALWMEALEPGKPLSFLDHHIQCGNSLLGATPALLAEGIPDEVFEPIEGDDKAVCRELKRQNKEERRGQGRLTDDLRPWEQLGNLPAAIARLECIPDDTVEAVHEKERQYTELQSEDAYRKSGHFLADAWCAAFVWKKFRDADLLPITHARFRRIEKNPYDVGPQEYAEVRRLAGQYQFFHWHLAFPGVFRYPAKGEPPDNELVGWCGGFDVILGNPPWERIKLQEQEWFAAHGRPDIAGARTAAIRGKLIQELEDKDPALYQAFLEDRRKAEGESHLVRNSSCLDEVSSERRGLFPLSGRGDVNTYSLFAELNRNLIHPTGRVGCIVPSGIATDDTTKAFFQDLTETKSLVSLFDFENRDAIFPGVHRSYRFALITLAGYGCTGADAQFVFFAHQVDDLYNEDKQFSLSSDEIRILNPNTRTCPVFRTNKDAQLAKYLYRRVPVLFNVDSPSSDRWKIQVSRMFHSSDDSHLFLQHPGDNCIRLYESKFFWQYDHRHATVASDVTTVDVQYKLDPDYCIATRYYVENGQIPVKFRVRITDWIPVYRRITRSTDERTMVAAVVPRCGVLDSANCLYDLDAVGASLLVSNLNAFVLDYIARQASGGANLHVYVVHQLPVIPLAEYTKPCPWEPSTTLAEWATSRVLELTYTASDLKPFAEDLGYAGDPFFWDEARRAVIRAELDAAFFHLYGISEADADYILDNFPLVKAKDEDRYGTYRTKETILRCYQEMQEAAADRTGQTTFASQLDPPPGMPVPKDLFGFPVEPPRRERIIQAFIETRAGWSSEYMVCSPEANARYIRQAQTLAPGVAEEDANRELWNARRSGQLAHLPKSTTYSPDPKLKRYEFVIEWAYRHVIDQLVRHGHPSKHTTLERILCIPEWRQQFDELVGKLMERAEYQFPVLDYRWAAMTIRKRSGESRRAEPSLFDQPIPVAQAETRLPERPGVYLIRSDNERVFTGWTVNLRHQAYYLRETGAGSLVPTWLLDGRAAAKTIAYHELDDGTPEGRLHDLWRGNLRKKLPLLNLFEDPAA